MASGAEGLDLASRPPQRIVKPQMSAGPGGESLRDCQTVVSHITRRKNARGFAQDPRAASGEPARCL